jgi:hypothetical protein
MRLMRKLAVIAALIAALSGSAAAPKKKPVPIAPPAVAHPIALFLSELSNGGKRQVTFRANATGTRFFFEESAGVTVYRFADGHYVKEAFLAGAKLAGAMKRYASR